MANISIKVDLSKLKSVIQKKKDKSGQEVECLVIPIPNNHLYKGEKGIYLDLQAIELKNRKENSKDTHLIKQALPKDVYNGMSDEEKQAQPILGNAIYWGKTGVSESAQVHEAQVIDEDDDLPF